MNFHVHRSAHRRVFPCSVAILCIFICIFICIGDCRYVRGDETDAGSKSSNNIATLVEQLGDPLFVVREEANRTLLEIGEPALPLLRTAERHSLLEVRERASRIRKEIDKVVFEDVTKRFLQQGNSKQSYGLPAWDQFRAIAGDSRTSKLLFIMMLRNQRELAQFVEAAGTAQGTPSAPVATAALEARMVLEAQRLRDRNFRGQSPEVGDTLGLLMACSMFNESAPNEVSEMIYLSLYRGTHIEYFTKAGYGRCLRALVGNWMPKTQPALANDVLAIAMQRSIPEGAIVARRHLDRATDYETRAQALRCLARFGNESDIENVAKMLTEETIIYEFTARKDQGLARDGIRVENMPPPGFSQPIVPEVRTMIVRMSDLALAVCLRLGNEDVAKVFPNYEPSEQNGIELMGIAVASDEQQQRKQVIAKWMQEHPGLVEKSN